MSGEASETDPLPAVYQRFKDATMAGWSSTMHQIRTYPRIHSPDRQPNEHMSQFMHGSAPAEALIVPNAHVGKYGLFRPLGLLLVR